MRHPRSLRWQLTLAFTSLIALAVATAAVGMLILVERVVWSRLDAALEEEAETLAVLFDLHEHEDLTKAVAKIGSEQNLGTSKFVRVRTAYGETIAASGEVPFAGAEPQIGLVTEFATTGSDEHMRRVVSYPTGQGGWIQIGVGASGRNHLLHQARWTIGSVAVMLVAMLFALAFAITGRATGELTRLAAELETIEAAALDRRLSPRNTAEVDRLAQVLNRLLGRLESAMGELRRFTADAAHELRTPIAALRARLEVAIRRGRSAEGDRDSLIDALELTERLRALYEDLLLLTAVEAGMAGERKGHVLVDALVHEAAEFFGPVAEEQGRPFTCTGNGNLGVDGSERLLKRVVLNLVGNAFQHTPPHTPVHLALRPENDAAVLEIRDEGPGIDASDLPFVFERFRRGVTSTAGTGLGLAICREVVEWHGGRITLQSVAGAGTTVTVTLPLARS